MSDLKLIKINADLMNEYYAEFGRDVYPKNNDPNNPSYNKHFVNWVVSKANGLINTNQQALPINSVVFSEAELKAKLNEQKEEHRQWLEDEGYELLAERL